MAGILERAGSFLLLREGAGFISIYDNRPLTGNTLVARKTTLNELQSQAYLFCDENRSFKAVHEMLSTQVQKNLQPDQTRTLLSQLVNAGLMFQEDERYIALAVHRKSQTISDGEA